MRQGRAGRRTIPARAGETTMAPICATLRRDHPRTRGGDRPVQAGHGTVTGPSPHARGRLYARVRTVQVCGTIPARAGETERRMSRACRTAAGPSPHARGRRQGLDAHGGLQGTIPARAGETPMRARPRSAMRDHPRTRGGDADADAAKIGDAGPSPHARGRHVGARRARAHEGTIPARAGETARTRPPPHAAGDHPRTRGGDFSVSPRSASGRGPSPHARGRPRRRDT